MTVCPIGSCLLVPFLMFVLASFHVYYSMESVSHHRRFEPRLSTISNPGGEQEVMFNTIYQRVCMFAYRIVAWQVKKEKSKCRPPGSSVHSF